MATNLELFFRKILVYLGDVNRMDIRLSDLRKEASELGIDTKELNTDFAESDKTLDRIKAEANALHDNVDNELE